MTADEFRQLVLSLPGVVERSHMGHPDFRIDNKIFASIGPRDSWGMVKLNPAQQANCMKRHPKMFVPSAGAWGKRGATTVVFEHAKSRPVLTAIRAALANVLTA